MVCAALTQSLRAGPAPRVSRSSMLVVQAAAPAATTAPARKKTLKALDLTKRKLIDSNGGRAVRNVDSEIYELVYQSANDSVVVMCRTLGMQYATEVGKDNRIFIILESATPLAGSPPSFAQLQAVLKASGPGPECINGRLAMLAILGTAGVELATERTLLEQLSTPLGAAAAVALAVAVAAASLVPLLLGKVRPAAAFPSDQASYADTQLPYFWTALAETMNGRVAMVGLVGLVVTELIRGAPVF